MNLNINVTANTKQAEGAFAGFYSKLRNVNNSLSNISKDANRTSGGFKGMTTAFSGLNQAMGMAGLYALATGLKSCIKASMDMTETVNLFNISLGEMAVKTNENVVALSELSGLDLTNLQNAVATYALLARSMGMTSEQASILSENTAKLALDLSSAVNIPINQVMADLKSGLVGQSETVYKYGIDVTEAGLKTEAMNQGIQKSVRDMSQGEKMALRYAVMIRRTALIQGDFARTIDTPANQLRILHERLITLARSIGNIFIPALTFVLPYLNAFVQMLTNVANSIASFFGYTAKENNTVKNISNSFEDMSENVGDVGDSADDSTKSIKAMKNALMGIDEINLLPKDTPSSGGGKKAKVGGSGGGGDILGSMQLPTYDNLMSGIKSKSDEILASMNAFMKNFIGSINFTNLIWAFDKLSRALEPLTKTIGQGLIWLWYNVFVPLSKWTIEDFLPAFISMLADALYALDNVLRGLAPTFQWLWDSFLLPIAKWTGGLIVTSLFKLGMAFIASSDDVVTGTNNIIYGLAEVAKTVKEVFVKNILPIVQSVFEDMTDIFTGLFDTCEMVFNDLWNDVVKPVVDNFIKFALPVLSKFVVDAVSIFRNLFNNVKYLFDLLWREGIKPALDIIVKIWNDMIISLNKFYNENAKPIFDQLKTAFNNTANSISTIWTTTLKPIWDNFMVTLDWLWSKHLKPLLDRFLEFAGVVIDCALRIYNYFIVPLTNWFVKNLKDPIVTAFNTIVNAIGWTLSVASDVCGGVIRVFTGLVQFVTGTLTGNWRLAWQGFKNVIGGIFDGLWGIIKGGINVIVGGINNAMWRLESWCNGAIDGFNRVILAWNYAKSAMGISGWTYPISHVDLPWIPYLARGGILQGGQLFNAGENGMAEAIGSYQGKTTVMPLENTDFVKAMYDAVFNAVTTAMGSSSGESRDLVLQVGTTEFGRVAINSINRVSAQEGRILLNL